MAYEKTAKDLAWDREQAKLQHESKMWKQSFERERESKLILANKNKELEDHIEALELAIIELSKGQMTPDEAVKHMRKQFDAHDMLSFLAIHFSLMEGCI